VYQYCYQGGQWASLSELVTELQKEYGLDRNDFYKLVEALKLEANCLVTPYFDAAHRLTQSLFTDASGNPADIPANSDHWQHVVKTLQSALLKVDHPLQGALSPALSLQKTVRELRDFIKSAEKTYLAAKPGELLLGSPEGPAPRVKAARVRVDIKSVSSGKTSGNTSSTNDIGSKRTKFDWVYDNSVVTRVATHHEREKGYVNHPTDTEQRLPVCLGCYGIGHRVTHCDVEAIKKAVAALGQVKFPALKTFCDSHLAEWMQYKKK
jgi:hypothetical protein